MRDCARRGAVVLSRGLPRAPMTAATTRLLVLCLLPVLYVVVAAIRSTGGGTWALAAMPGLPAALWVSFRLTEPRSIGDDLVGEAARVGFRLTLTGGAIFLAARSAGAGRAAFDAAAAAGVGLAGTAALVSLARVPASRGLLGVDPAARRLDAASAVALLGVIAMTVPAMAFLVPSRRGTVDPLTIDYTMLAQGSGTLLLLTLAAARFRLSRRLELGAADRGSAGLAVAATALMTSAPAAWLGFAAPDRVLPAGALLAASALALAMVIPDATVVSRSLRTLLVVCVCGAPIALFTAATAAAAPKQAGGTVLMASLLLLLVGVLAPEVSARFVPDAARWLGAIEKAHDRASTPEPTVALATTLNELRERLGPSSDSPALYRLERGDVLTVDRAGYLHESIGALPAELLDFCDAEPEQTFRLEVARALQVRRPEVRGALAWMEAHGYASATALRDEEGPVGVLALPRGKRRAALTLQEAQALGRLTERLGAVFALSSAMAGARQRQLDAEAEGRRLLDALAQARNALARQGERHAIAARRLVHRAPVGRYSPASRLVAQDIEREVRSPRPLVLRVPAGVPAESFAAAAHLQGPRSEGPFVVIDGADAREHPLTRWLDQVTSPLLLAHQGTLVLLDAAALPDDVQRFVARLMVDPAAHDWRAPWLDAPTSLDVGWVVGVREDVATLMASGRLTRELGEVLGETVVLPPLGDRPEDLRSLCLDHLARVGLALRGRPIGLTDEALGWLLEQPFLVNDQELEVTLVAAVLRCEGTALREADVRAAAGARGAPGESLRPPAPPRPTGELPVLDDDDLA